MTQPLCRWGILGTANIARKNWKAIANAGNATLAAVASRDRARAQNFIDDCQQYASFTPAPDACGSYEELLDRKDIDAVYIPLPTGIRKDWVIRAAAAGKHVLCEKPCGVNAGEVQAMIDACRKHRVQFMDGVMFMHSARLPLMREVLGDGRSIGAIRRITSAFSFLGAEEFLAGNIRVSNELEPLGALGDLGWYNIRFSLWAMNYHTPERVAGRILSKHGRGDSSQPVPTEFAGELHWPGGVSASFYCSFLTQNQQWGHISGTKGSLNLSDFVIPFYGSESGFEVSVPVFTIRGCDFNMEGHVRRLAVREYSNSGPDSQETNMVRTFSSLATSDQLDWRWADIALQTQQVLDSCLQSAREDGRLVTIT